MTNFPFNESVGSGNIFMRLDLFCRGFFFSFSFSFFFDLFRFSFFSLGQSQANATQM